jgi:hypothetical protein
LKDPEPPSPVCAKVTFYRDGQDGNDYGQKGYLLVRIGNSKDGISGPPGLFYPEIGVYEGISINSGVSDRLADLPALLDLPVVTGNLEKLYLAIVAHRPIGIPTAAEMSIIKGYLSRRLTTQLQAAQACENDYRRQQTVGTSPPGWLKSNLFSGEKSHALPVDAAVNRKEKQSDGSYLVYVDLEPAEAVIKRGGETISFHGGYTWEVVARVASENGRFVVDDLRIYDRFPASGPSYLLSEVFAGCQGDHWIGIHNVR